MPIYSGTIEYSGSATHLAGQTRELAAGTNERLVAQAFGASVMPPSGVNAHSKSGLIDLENDSIVWAELSNLSTTDTGAYFKSHASAISDFNAAANYLWEHNDAELRELASRALPLEISQLHYTQEVVVALTKSYLGLLSDDELQAKLKTEVGDYNEEQAVVDEVARRIESQVRVHTINSYGVTVNVVVQPQKIETGTAAVAFDLTVANAQVEGNKSSITRVSNKHEQINTFTAIKKAAMELVGASQHHSIAVQLDGDGKAVINETVAKTADMYDEFFEVLENDLVTVAEQYGLDEDADDFNVASTYSRLWDELRLSGSEIPRNGLDEATLRAYANGDKEATVVLMENSDVFIKKFQTALKKKFSQYADPEAYAERALEQVLDDMGPVDENTRYHLRQKAVAFAEAVLEMYVNKLSELTDLQSIMQQYYAPISAHNREIIEMIKRRLMAEKEVYLQNNDNKQELHEFVTAEMTSLWAEILSEYNFSSNFRGLIHVYPSSFVQQCESLVKAEPAVMSESLNTRKLPVEIREEMRRQMLESLKYSAEDNLDQVKEDFVLHYKTLHGYREPDSAELGRLYDVIGREISQLGTIRFVATYGRRPENIDQFLEAHEAEIVGDPKGGNSPSSGAAANAIEERVKNEMEDAWYQATPYHDFSDLFNQNLANELNAEVAKYEQNLQEAMDGAVADFNFASGNEDDLYEAVREVAVPQLQEFVRNLQTIMNDHVIETKNMVAEDPDFQDLFLGELPNSERMDADEKAMHLRLFKHYLDKQASSIVMESREGLESLVEQLGYQNAENYAEVRKDQTDQVFGQAAEQYVDSLDVGVLAPAVMEDIAVLEEAASEYFADEHLAPSVEATIEFLKGFSEGGAPLIETQNAVDMRAMDLLRGLPKPEATTFEDLDDEGIAYWFGRDWNFTNLESVDRENVSEVAAWLASADFDKLFGLIAPNWRNKAQENFNQARKEEEAVSVLNLPDLVTDLNKLAEDSKDAYDEMFANSVNVIFGNLDNLLNTNVAADVKTLRVQGRNKIDAYTDEYRDKLSKLKTNDKDVFAKLDDLNKEYATQTDANVLVDAVQDGLKSIAADHEQETRSLVINQYLAEFVNLSGLSEDEAKTIFAITVNNDITSDKVAKLTPADAETLTAEFAEQYKYRPSQAEMDFEDDFDEAMSDYVSYMSLIDEMKDAFEQDLEASNLYDKAKQYLEAHPEEDVDIALEDFFDGLSDDSVSLNNTAEAIRTIQAEYVHSLTLPNPDEKPETEEELAYWYGAPANLPNITLNDVANISNAMEDADNDFILSFFDPNWQDKAMDNWQDRQ